MAKIAAHSFSVIPTAQAPKTDAGGEALSISVADKPLNRTVGSLQPLRGRLGLFAFPVRLSTAVFVGFFDFHALHGVAAQNVLAYNRVNGLNR